MWPQPHVVSALLGQEELLDGLARHHLGKGPMLSDVFQQNCLPGWEESREDSTSVSMSGEGHSLRPTDSPTAPPH